MAEEGLDRYQRGGIHHQAEKLAAVLPPLMVAAERVAATVSQGVHGRRRIGQGETFWQFRRYQPGDSTQLIDWRQSGKSQRLYVRETEWEAAQSVWLWRDASPSMNYRSAPDLPTKQERSDLLLLALASLLVRGGERVTLLGTGMAPGSGRSALRRLANMIEENQTPRESLPPFDVLPRYARMVMVGDFLSPIAEIERAIRGFALRGVRGHLVQVLDPAEETLPFAGRVRFEGMESEGDIIIGRVETVRDDYIDLLARHCQGLDAVTRSLGWSLAVHRTDRPPQAALLGLFMKLSEMVTR